MKKVRIVMKSVWTAMLGFFGIKAVRERKKIEKALRESEGRYRALFENAIEGIFQNTLDGRIIMCNAALARMLGYASPREAVEDLTDIGSRVYADPGERRIIIERLLRESKVGGLEALFKRKDGTRIKVLLNFRLVRDRDGNPASIEGSCIDITAKWEAEEALRKAEARYRRLYDGMMDAFASVTLDGVIVECNDAYLAMLGYREDEIKRLSYQDITPEKWHAFEARIIEQEVMARGYSDSYTKEYRRKDGTVFPVELRTYLLRDDQGRPSGMWGFIRDITERKQAEDRLRAANRQLEGIIEFLPDATIITDSGGRIIAWNRAIEEMTGIPKAQILGKDHVEAARPFYGRPGPYLLDFLDRDDGEIAERYRNIRRKGDALSSEVFAPSLYQGRGAYIWIIASPLYDRNGNVVGAIECIRDSTDRHRAEEALVQNEERYRLLADNVSDIIFTMDTNLRFTYISPSVERIRGFTVQEARSQSISEVLTPASLDVAREAFRQALEMEVREPRELWWKRTLELEEICKDGSTIWTETSFTLLRDNDKRYIGFLGITRDITERKKAMEEKARLETQLSQAQKMESIGTLAGGIAHDFNNILSAIIGFSELAIEDASEPDKVRKNIREVLKAGDRAKDLVSQILTFSRKTDTVYSPLVLRTVIKESLKMIRSLIPTTIDIRQDLRDSGLVLSNPTQVHQIIMNLGTNAAHAMDETGGILGVSLERVTIGDDAHAMDVKPGTYLKLSISDTGQGMPPEIMERMFEPYFTTKKMGRGTGLGLSVVHGIVKSHSGAITCTSVPGQGTAFDVYLPEIQSEAQGLEKSERETYPTGNERILFIDDEPALVSLAEGVLSKLGYKITAKTSSTEALDFFKQNPDQIDLVITDMTMPAMTGDKVARKIMEIRGDMPVILCTGYSEHISEEKAREMGIRAYLLKPLEMRGLATTIRRVLDGKHVK